MNRLKFHIFFSPEGFPGVGGGNGNGNGSITKVEDVTRPGQLPRGTDERAILDNAGDRGNKPPKAKSRATDSGDVDSKEDDATDDSDDDKVGEDEDDSGDESDNQEDVEDESEEEVEEETEDEEDTEEEDENVTEEDLEDDSVFQALKKHDKDIFKKVPGLRATIFREAQFTKYYATPAEAEEAYKKAEALTNFEQDLGKGESGKLIDFLHSSKSLKKFSANLLSTIEKADKETFYGIIAPEFKKFFRAALKDPNTAIQTSAKNLHYFFFGNQEFDKDEGLVPETKSQRELDIEKREQEINERNFKVFAKDLTVSSEKRAKRIIEKGFEGSNITDWHKQKLVEDIYTRVIQTMDRDVRYTGNIRAMLRKAASEGFTSEGKESLLNAFLSRAKLLIPQVRQKVLKEARIEAKAGDGKRKKARRVPSSSASTPGGKKKFDPKRDMKPGMSERDILDGNY